VVAREKSKSERRRKKKNKTTTRRGGKIGGGVRLRLVLQRGGTLQRVGKKNLGPKNPGMCGRDPGS